MRRSNDDIEFVRAQNANLLGVIELVHETIKEREEALDTWVLTDHARQRLHRALEVSERLAGKDFLEKVKQIAADLESADKYLRAVEASRRAYAEALPPNEHGEHDVSSILTGIQQLRERSERLEALLGEAMPLVVRVPGGEALYSRIHRELQGAGSPTGVAAPETTSDEPRQPAEPTPHARNAERARQYRDNED